jgi:HlyD family secretion protein
MFRSRRFWLILIGAVILLAAAGVVASRVVAGRQQSAAALKLGEVTQITAVSSVESSGAVVAEQSAQLVWGTTGTVETVAVKPGDKVKVGDVLMSLNPLTAPQNVILAQADLISAKKALDELLNPTDLALANARKTLADAKDALDKAQRDLKSVENPAGKGVYTAVSDAQLALDTAQANLELTNNSADVQAYNNAKVTTDQAFRRYQDAKAKYDESNGKTELLQILQQAEANYQNALSNQNTLWLKIQTDKANKEDAVQKAQDKYNDAVANLNGALAGPDANKLAIAQAKVAVAEAAYADAQDKLNKLLNGADPADIASATARYQATLATVGLLAVRAPFDGEVLVVNQQPGDTTSPGSVAVTLVDRSQLHIDVSIDESDVSNIQLGDPVTVTFDSIPDLTLGGEVALINPLGTTQQGLVRYAVRVNLIEIDPRVLLGMTANVNIVTDTNEGALAVPLDAVQLDQDGEFVNRLRADNSLERVPVKSGDVQGELVVVTGNLAAGDKVQIVEPKPVNSGSPFGG